MKTLGEMILDLWNQLGDVPELDPYGSNSPPAQNELIPTSYGFKRLKRVVNDSLIAVFSWKHPSRIEYFDTSSFVEKLFIKGVEVSGEIPLGTTPSTTSIPLAEPATIDQYSGYSVEINDESRIVVSNTTNSLILAVGLTEAPEIGDTYTLRSNLISYGTSKRIAEVFRCRDLLNDRDLDLVQRTAEIYISDATLRVPTTWGRVGNYIRFNAFINNDHWFQLEAKRFPNELVDPTDVPELPEQYHEAIVLYALGWGFSFTIEPEKAQAAQVAFQNFMLSRQSSVNWRDERRDLKYEFNKEG